MKFFANSKKLNKLGASMVEYAIVLACIASLGVSVSDNLTNVLNKPFNSITSILGLASGGNQTQTTQQRIYDLFIGLNGKDHGGNAWESLEKDIVSSCVYIEKLANIDTAYSVRSKDMLNNAKLEGLIPQNATDCKLITVANESGVQPTPGSQNDPSTHFSATQYLFYNDGNKLYLAATRNLDTVYVSEEGNHPTIASGETYGYTQKNNFTKGKYKVGENSWKDLHDLSNFVK